MSPDVQRLKHIRDYCVAIHQTIQRYGASFEIYASDPDYQRSVCFSILQIGELSSGLSEDFRQKTNNLVPWRSIKAMRNLVAHNYGKMDQATVWETATVDIPVLQAFCEEQIDSLSN